MIQAVPSNSAATLEHPPMQKAVVALTVLGLCASFGAMLCYIRASKAQIGTNPYFYGDIVKDPIYYALHGAEILCLFSAGLLALWLTNRREFSGGYLSRFLLFLGAGGLMTARGYTLPNLFSTKLVDATGPFMCLISVVVFIGVRRCNWAVLDKVFLTASYVLSAATLFEIASLRTTSRVEAVRSMAPILSALYWFAAWTALREYPRDSRARYFRFAPLVAYALGSLFTALRLNLVMLSFLLATCSYADYRRGVPQAKRWLIALAATLWLVLFSTIFLPNSSAFKRVEAAAESLYSRLDEDTRTGQLLAFFDSVQPQELLLGRGSFAKWWWNGEDWNGGTDYGYLDLLLYGGAPLLLTYFALHGAEALATLWRGPRGLQLTASVLVLLWTIRMFSTAEPNLALDYYPVLLCVGASIARGTGPAGQRVAIATTFQHGSRTLLHQCRRTIARSASQAAFFKDVRDDATNARSSYNAGQTSVSEVILPVQNRRIHAASNHRR
jgi:hypothetical protein